MAEFVDDIGDNSLKRPHLYLQKIGNRPPSQNSSHAKKYAESGRLSIEGTKGRAIVVKSKITKANIVQYFIVAILYTCWVP